ncbi:unnamed protein product [Victoria cruziana]
MQAFGISEVLLFAKKKLKSAGTNGTRIQGYACSDYGDCYRCFAVPPPHAAAFATTTFGSAPGSHYHSRHPPLPRLISRGRVRKRKSCTAV